MLTKAAVYGIWATALTGKMVPYLALYKLLLPGCSNEERVQVKNGIPIPHYTLS